MFKHEDLTITPIATGVKEGDILLEVNLARLSSGELFVTYTSGGTWEPCNENKTFFVKSSDNGKNWSEREILFQHPKKGVFTPELFTDGDRLYAFLNTYNEETLHAQNVDTFYSYSDDNGKTFTSPASLPGGIKAVHIKQATRLDSGRLILSCSWMETDGECWASPFGDRPCIVAGKEIERKQTDVHEWWWSNNCEYCGCLISDDNGETFRLCGRIGVKGKRYVEPVFVRLKNGALCMLMRTGQNLLAKSLSFDEGETWSEAEITDIPTAVAKTLLLQDKNGTIYMMHNPNQKYHRDPLELWISRDDMASWEKITLLSSAPEAFGSNTFTYPDGFIDEENKKICFVWENRKEAFYSEFPIDKYL